MARRRTPKVKLTRSHVSRDLISRSQERTAPTEAVTVKLLREDGKASAMEQTRSRVSERTWRILDSLQTRAAECIFEGFQIIVGDVRVGTANLTAGVPMGRVDSPRRDAQRETAYWDWQRATPTDACLIVMGVVCHGYTLHDCRQRWRMGHDKARALLLQGLDDYVALVGW